MKTKIPSSLALLLVVPIHSNEVASNNAFSYLLGGIIAVLIMGYLIYTLFRPEKF